jgi:hypothetical protein
MKMKNSTHQGKTAKQWFKLHEVMRKDFGRLLAKITRAKTVLAAVALAMCGITAQAQTVTNTVYVTNTLAATTALNTLWNDVKGATNYAIAPYATYAPSAPTKFGGGLLAIYNVNQYMGAGVGGDWLGNFTMFSGNIELKLPTHPLANYGFPNLEVTPFVLGGIGTPIAGAGGSNGGLSTIQDIGVYMKFGHLLGGQFGFGGSVGRWTGSGPYDVTRFHAFISWQKGF